MLSGDLIVEQFGYAIADADVPLFSNATGQPTGETARIRDLIIDPNIDVNGGRVLNVAPILHVRFRGMEMWEAFVNEITGAGTEQGPKIQIAGAGALKSLPKLNGGLA